MNSRPHNLISLIESNFKKNYSNLFEQCIAEFLHPPEMIVKTDDFGESGRGRQYLNSVFSCPSAREEGVCSLLTLFSNEDGNVILDGFGGNAYVAKVAQQNGFKPIFITNDLSPDMVVNAIEDGFPATWQSADNLSSIRDNSLDGVLYAYGVHHLPLEKRLIAFKEVHRVLKDGGKFVLHDFTNESTMARFFKDVVDEYSVTGHDFPHFDESETRQMLTEAGFRVDSLEKADDFVFEGKNENDVLRDCANYIHSMYGLEKFGNIGESDTMKGLLDVTDRFLGIAVNQVNSHCECRVKRNAIVFVSDK